MKPVTRQEREKRHEADIRKMVDDLQLVASKAHYDGWYTLRRPDGSSVFATKVSLTNWGHIVLVGDAVDIVFRGGDPMCTQLARLRWLAESDSDYLARKCIDREDTFDAAVAIGDIDSRIAEEDDEERKEALSSIREHVADHGPFEEVADEWRELGFENWPGECHHRDIITARALVRRLVALLEAAQ